MQRNVWGSYSIVDEDDVAVDGKCFAVKIGPRLALYWLLVSRARVERLKLSLVYQFKRNQFIIFFKISQLSSA